MEATYKVSFYYKKLKLTVNKLPSTATTCEVMIRPQRAKRYPTNMENPESKASLHEGWDKVRCI